MLAGGGEGVGRSRIMGPLLLSPERNGPLSEEEDEEEEDVQGFRRAGISTGFMELRWCLRLVGTRRGGDGRREGGGEARAGIFSGSLLRRPLLLGSLPGDDAESRLGCEVKGAGGIE